VSALGWQEVVVALAVIGALAYLVRRRLQRKGEGCEGCIQTAVEIRAAARGGGTLIPIESLGRIEPRGNREHKGAAPPR